MDQKSLLMAQFYEECQKKGYTNMQDDIQSLKAKVIATDMKLKYGDIIAFYEKARQCYEDLQSEKEIEAKKAAKRAVNGVLLAEIYDGNGRNRNALCVFIRPDCSIYTEYNNGCRMESYPVIEVKSSSITNMKYNPSQAVYTGATVGGITTGGVHYTQPSYSMSSSNTSRGYIIAKLENVEFTVDHIAFSDYTQQRFKRDSQFRSLAGNGEVKCSADGTLSKMLVEASMAAQSYADKMNALSGAADYNRLPYSDCQRIASLLFRVISGETPPSDEEIYAMADALSKENNSEKLNQAIEKFTLISDYSDAAKRVRETKEKYEDVLQTEKERAILKKEEQKKRNKKLALIFGATAVLALCMLLLVTKVIMPNAKYKEAEGYLAAEQYEDAIAVFTELGNYQDAADRVVEAKKEKTYAAAEALLAAKDFTAAMETFASLGSYRDAADRVADTQTAFETWKAEQYSAAESMVANGDYDNASDVFAKLGDYQDSADMVRYANAAKLLAGSSYDDAMEAFTELGSFRDAETRVLECWYEKGKEFRAQNLYFEAAQCWTTSYAFADSHDLLMECCYTWALERLEAEDFETAYVLLEDCVKYGDYLDAAEILRESRISRAEAYVEKGWFLNAAELYRAVPDEQKADYYGGKSAYVAGKYYTAKKLLTLAGDYEDAAELAAEAAKMIEKIERICGTYEWDRGASYDEDDYADSSEVYADRIFTYGDEDGFDIYKKLSYGTFEDYFGFERNPDEKFITSTTNDVICYYQIEGDYLVYYIAEKAHTWYKKVQ